MLDKINTFVQPYVDQLTSLLASFPYYIQAAIILGIAIFVLVGLIVFLKKYIKLFLVLAILFAIFYFVSTQTSILPNVFESISTTSNLLLIF